MPRGVSKGGSLASALRKEMQASFEKALKAGDLATSKEIKQLTKAIRTLSAVMRKSPGAAVKGITIAGQKKRGRKPKATVCSVKGCGRPHYAKGLCASHYNMSLRKKKLAKEGKAAKRGAKKGKKRGPKPKARAAKAKVTAKRAAKSCRIKGCKNPHYAKGLCRKHYMAKQYAAKKKAKKK